MYLWIAVAGLWGYIIGYNQRQIIDFLKKIDSKIKEPEITRGVVSGNKVMPVVSTKEVINDGKPARVVKPKTPKQIEIEDKIKFEDEYL